MLFYFLLLVIVLSNLPRVIMVSLAGKKTYLAEEVPPTRAAIVFGAGLTASGAPTAVLKDRVTTAVNLYQAGKVEKILMSVDPVDREALDEHLVVGADERRRRLAQVASHDHLDGTAGDHGVAVVERGDGIRGQGYQR